MDLFVRQFAWVRALSEAADKLFSSGHFDFLPHYYYSYTLQVPLGGWDSSQGHGQIIARLCGMTPRDKGTSMFCDCAFP